LKKRTKKLLFLGLRGPAGISLNGQKFFASFFQKRRPYFAGLAPGTSRSRRMKACTAGTSQ
jgi:hypothetical protein